MRARVLSALLPLGAGLLALTAAPEAQSPASATFARDVAPILYENCASCHRPGQMAPMPLLTYEQVRPFARSIRAQVANRTMPPWHAEAPAGTFLNERSLSEEQREVLVRWVDAGAPLGDPADLPPLPAFPEGWTIGTPDVVLSMDREYEVPAAGEVPYQYFELPTHFAEDRWVQAIELRPGAPGVVHHILAFARSPGESAAPSPFRTVPAAGAGGGRGRGGAGPAREGLGQSTTTRGSLIATTAPGTNAMVFEPGSALLIRAGAVISFQVHYTASGTAARDRSSIGFVFAKEPPAQEVRTSAFINALFSIPPGAADHRVDAVIEFTEDTRVSALFPHTHLRGKRWEYQLTYPDGRTEVVLSVPKYDFNWQTYYQYRTPLAIPKGSRLLAVAHYDNSPANRANPDPAAAVRWGEQTWEEMQYSGITYTVDAGREPAR